MFDGLPYCMFTIQRNLNITKIFLEQLQGIEISCFMKFNGRKWKTNFLLKTMHEI